MANSRAIKSRIKSAKNISQITRAMEMVSAAKMKKAQLRLGQSEIYAHKLHEMMTTLSSLLDSRAHPLLAINPHPKSALIVIVSSDKGLAGALNSNLFREIAQLEKGLLAQNISATYIAVGKKSRDFLRYTRRNIHAVFDGLGDNLTYAKTLPVSKIILDTYLSHEFDVVYAVYPKFLTTLSQKTTLHKILPVALQSDRTERATQAQAVPLFEPSSDILLDKLLPYYVEQEIYQFLLQENASEHSARMIAMKNATDNAKDIRKELLLEYNSARQAQITQQIAEIASATMI